MSYSGPKFDRDNAASILKHLIFFGVALCIWCFLSRYRLTRAANILTLPAMVAFAGCSLFYAYRLYHDPPEPRLTSEISSLLGVALGFVLALIQMSFDSEVPFVVAVILPVLLLGAIGICARFSRQRAVDELEAAKQAALIRDQQKGKDLSALRESNNRTQATINSFVPELRRHWAKCHEFVGDYCTLKHINDAIEAARSHPSPQTGLVMLQQLHDQMSRDSVRITTEQYYDQLEPYIENIVPRDEFDRLMSEAKARSTTPEEYGRNLIDLGEWLSSIAGPAKGRWQAKQQEQHAAAYEQLFRNLDDGEPLRVGQSESENPFEAGEEPTREARTG